MKHDREGDVKALSLLSSTVFGTKSLELFGALHAISERSVGQPGEAQTALEPCFQATTTTSDNGAYVMSSWFVSSVPVSGPDTVPFTGEEAVPESGQLNN
jgi:hypothetical protein